MNDDDAHAGSCDIDGAGDPAFAFQPHLSERAFEKLEVWLSDTLQTMHLNQFDDSLKVGTEIDRQSVKCGLGFLVEKSYSPWHEDNIPFLQCIEIWNSRFMGLELGTWRG